MNLLTSRRLITKSKTLIANSQWFFLSVFITADFVLTQLKLYYAWFLLRKKFM